MRPSSGGSDRIIGIFGGVSRGKIMMRVVPLLATICGLGVAAVDTAAQSIGTSRGVVTDSSIWRQLTAPDDLADGNLQTSARIARQRIVVGGRDAEVPGFTSASIQIAVDALTLRGGGTVELGPGTYSVSAPIRLGGNMVLIGAGDSTILRKTEGYRSFLTVDADYGMYKVTVQDACGFRAGMGVQISDTQYSSDYDVTVATIVEIDGNTIFLDQPAVRDYDCAHRAVLSNTCSIIEAVGVANVRIANVRIDGNGLTNDELSGCRGGAVYLHRVEKCTVENVRAANFNGDVFDWQITKNVTLRNCEASRSTGEGFHPGTGSESTLVEGCSSHHNRDGIYLCWRVKKSVFRNNVLYENTRDGISLNKKNTDNLVSGNHIYGNGRDGVWFNDYGEANNSHRNAFVANVVEDNGKREAGHGFSLVSAVRDIRIEGNTIRDSGTGTQRCAILLGRRALNVDIRGNTIAGHPDGEVIRK